MKLVKQTFVPNSVKCSFNLEEGSSKASFLLQCLACGLAKGEELVCCAVICAMDGLAVAQYPCRFGVVVEASFYDGLEQLS